MKPGAVARLLCLPALCLALLGPGSARGLAETPVTVFGAASLTEVFEQLGARYEERTGQPLRFSFASSSTLARQIEAGAPAHVFASANQDWMDYLAARDLIDEDSRISPISNRLVLVAPADSPRGRVTIGADLDLAALLGAGERLAVGDPAHVPAGIYARQALTSLGLWERIEPHLAQAEDVRAALALVARGEAPLGIVYATDAALSDQVRVLGTFPADSHAPITYPFATVAGAASPEALAAFAFLTGAEARAVYRAAGFEVR